MSIPGRSRHPWWSRVGGDPLGAAPGRAWEGDPLGTARTGAGSLDPAALAGVRPRRTAAAVGAASELLHRRREPGSGGPGGRTAKAERERGCGRAAARMRRPSSSTAAGSPDPVSPTSA